MPNDRSEDPAPQIDYYASAEATLPGAGLGGYSLPNDVRFVIERAHGGRLCATDGREFIDYVCGAGATIIGHDHPDVVAAVQQQVARGMHYFGTLNSAAVALAEVLVDTIPCAERVVYASTGSEATAYALRIARAFTDRDKVLKFEGAYHGNHDYASFSQFPTHPANYPNASPDSGGVPAALSDTMLVAPYNDIEVAESIIAEHHKEMAAIIVEPVQRIMFPKPGFLDGLRRAADRYGVLLIFDEVVTGFRLALGGAQEHFGVMPDLAAYGKIVGGGGPLSCIGGRADILDSANPNRKGSAGYAYVNGTLHGNPVAAVAGMATLTVLMEPDFYSHFNAQCDRSRAALQTVLDRHRIPAKVSGQSSFWQFLFTDNEPANQMEVLAADPDSSKRLDLELLRRNIYVLPNVRRFFSAAHTDQDLSQTVEALDAACATF